MPALMAAPAAPVVTVTSFARLLGQPVDPANPYLDGSHDPWRAYGQAKLANYHFGLGLQDAFARAGSSVSSLMAHPGMAHTDLQPTTVQLGGAPAPLVERDCKPRAHAATKRPGAKRSWVDAWLRI